MAFVELFSSIFTPSLFFLRRRAPTSEERFFLGMKNPLYRLGTVMFECFSVGKGMRAVCTLIGRLYAVKPVCCRLCFQGIVPQPWRIPPFSRFFGSTLPIPFPRFWKYIPQVFTFETPRRTERTRTPKENFLQGRWKEPAPGGDGFEPGRCAQCVRWPPLKIFL